MVEKKFFHGSVFLVNLSAKYPSTKLSYTLLLFSLGCILLTPWLNLATPLIMWIIFVSVVNSLSSLLFIFAPYRFPYSLEIFTDIYMKTELFIWCLIPWMLGLASLPLPASLVSKIGLIIFTLFYSLVFSVLRYIIFLYLLATASLLFMAMLFFCFGAFWDFIYIVGFYSFYLSVISKRMKERKEEWQWLY